MDIHKADEKLTGIACVSRMEGDSPFFIATPCGICQERLFHWGYEVEIAVPTADDPTQWTMKTLGEIQPHHWVKAYLEDNE
jgi:cytidine deaminase